MYDSVMKARVRETKEIKRRTTPRTSSLSLFVHSSNHPGITLSLFLVRQVKTEDGDLRAISM